MQSIPHHSLEDIERSRAEMAAFMNEKHVWPGLTGEDIHRAYNLVEHSMEGHPKPWDAISEIAKAKYEAMAAELNRELEKRRNHAQETT